MHIPRVEKIFVRSAPGGKGVLPATVTRECDDLLALGFANGEAGRCYVKKRGMYGPGFESFRTRSASDGIVVAR